MVGAVGAYANAEMSKSEQSKTKLAEDMDKFLHLLVTQLKNQDPLNPMDSTEFTAQLVQFASVEQQIQSNANLEMLLEGQKESHLASMTSYVGREVEARSNQLPLENGKARIGYLISKGVKQSSVVVTDDTGKVVFSKSGKVAPGKHYIDWDGRDKDGKKLKDGLYKVEVTAEDKDGDSVWVDVTTVGEVKAVWINGGDTQFELLNGAIVDISAILNVRQPGAADDTASEKTDDKAADRAAEKTGDKAAEKTGDKAKEKTGGDKSDDDTKNT